MVAQVARGRIDVWKRVDNGVDELDGQKLFTCLIVRVMLISSSYKCPPAR